MCRVCASRDCLCSLLVFFFAFGLFVFLDLTVPRTEVSTRLDFFFFVLLAVTSSNSESSLLLQLSLFRTLDFFGSGAVSSFKADSFFWMNGRPAKFVFTQKEMHSVHCRVSSRMSMLSPTAG